MQDTEVSSKAWITFHCDIFSFAMFKNEDCQTDGVLTQFWKQYNTGRKKKTGKKTTFGQNTTGQSYKAKNKKKRKNTL